MVLQYSTLACPVYVQFMSVLDEKRFNFIHDQA